MREIGSLIYILMNIFDRLISRSRTHVAYTARSVNGLMLINVARDGEFGDRLAPSDIAPKFSRVLALISLALKRVPDDTLS